MARILVIEDNEAVRRLVERILRDSGHEVAQASESSDALRLWRSLKIDLVIADIGLPGRSGVEAIIDIRSVEPELPVVLISGRGEQDVIELITGAGLLSSVQVVTKPFHAGQLVGIVQAALDKPQFPSGRD